MKRTGLIQAPGRLATRRFSRRSFLLHCAATAGIAGLLTACGQAAPPPPAPPAATPEAARKIETISTPAPATAVAKPVATAAPAAAKAEPKGRLVYAWHTTISPAWLDPQENPPQITPYNFAYALHDALVKHMPGKTFAPSLAESYEIAPDNKSANFKLRQGIKFHDGQPVTSEDVKFTFEKYRGANAGILKAKLERIDLPDDRTVKFVFKEPFLDFLTIYGSPASGAAWIVPKAYYEKVGKDGFKTAPIGAGPYRFVRQTPGTEMEFEAFPDYWRKVPSIKTIVIKGVPELATRVALLKTGEVDVSITLQGDLLETLKKDSSVRLTATKEASTFLD